MVRVREEGKVEARIVLELILQEVRFVVGVHADGENLNLILVLIGEQ